MSVWAAHAVAKELREASYNDKVQAIFEDTSLLDGIIDAYLDALTEIERLKAEARDQRSEVEGREDG